MSLEKKTIDSLQHLVVIGVDGEEGYEKAAQMVSSKNLLAQFEQLATSRNIQAEAIRNYLAENGVEKPAHEGDFSGIMHRAWLDIKGTLSNRSDSVSVSSCVSGDEAAIDAYEDVLKEDLPDDLRKLLGDQLQSIKSDLQDLKQFLKDDQ